MPSAPDLLNSSGVSDSGGDFFVELCTDRQGVWLAVWQSEDSLGGVGGTDGDIMVSRSNDDGATWTAAAHLNTTAGSDSGGDEAVTIATDGAGAWIAVWQSSENLGGSAGTDYDLFVSRSFDEGVTWSPPALLNANAASDSEGDFSADIHTDGLGAWVVAWQSAENLNGTAGGDTDILFARSIDNGATWTTPALLNANGTADAGDDAEVSIRDDGQGSWIAAWLSAENVNGTAGFDTDILFCRSNDGGATWSAPALLNSSGTGDSGEDGYPALAYDPAAGWIAVWHSAENLNGTAGLDYDIFFAQSFDDGASWTAPALLNANGSTDGGNDGFPLIARGAENEWVAMWTSEENLNGTAGTDSDIFFSASTDNGSNWTSPALLNANGDTDTGSDTNQSMATDGDGAWVAAWHSREDLNGTAGVDPDIFHVRVSVYKEPDRTLAGRIVSTGGAPVTCAAIEAAPHGGGPVRVAVTDLNGAYFFDRMAPEVYAVRVFSPDFGETLIGDVDLGGGPVDGADMVLTPTLSGRAVRGRVLDNLTGEPLVGVLVEALQHGAPFARAYTCASGDYLLPLSGDGEKGSITVTLRFSLENYETATVPGVVVPDGGVEIDEALVKAVPFPSTLAGYVHVSGRYPPEPVSGARVTLRGPVNVSAATDVYGLFQFPAVLGGAYTIAVSAPGYESLALVKTIPGDRVVSETIALTPSGEEPPGEEPTALPGDVNGDGKVDAPDVQLVINAVLGIAPQTVDGDANGDGGLDATDIQFVINIALGLTK